MSLFFFTSICKKTPCFLQIENKVLSLQKLFVKMDELLNPKVKTEIPAPAEQHYKFIGTMRLKRGMKVFELTKDGLIGEVDVKSEAILVVNPKTKQTMEIVKKKALWRPGSYYTQALNIKNALKKFHKAKLIVKI